MKLGWKTIAGTLILACGQLMLMYDETKPFAPLVDAVGIALGGIGLRKAITSNQGETK